MIESDNGPKSANEIHTDKRRCNAYFLDKYAFIMKCLIIASIICAIIAWPVSMVGIVLGIIAFAIAFHYRQFWGCIGAIVGISLCVISFLFFFFVVRPTTESRIEREKSNTVKFNLVQIGKAITGYTKSHEGYLPEANKWCDLLMEYDNSLSREDFTHPKTKDGVIAFNKNLGGKRLADVSQSTVLLFEAKGGWNLAGDAGLLEKSYMDRNIVYVLLSNNEIKTYWVKQGGIKENGNKFVPLRWVP